MTLPLRLCGDTGGSRMNDESLSAYQVTIILTLKIL